MSFFLDDLQKAFIKVDEGKHKGQRIEVLFNPEQYSINRSVQYANVAIPGTQTPIIQFIRGESDTLSLTLFFDTYTKDKSVDVRKEHIKKITDLLNIDEDLHAPPPFTFVWGNLHFKGFLEKADTTYTMFNHSGNPVRATMAISIKHLENTLESGDDSTPESQQLSSPDRTKIRTVIEGDSLWLLSFREYGDPSKWKIIAQENNLKDPKNLKPGTLLRIPPVV